MRFDRPQSLILTATYIAIHGPLCRFQRPSSAFTLLSSSSSAVLFVVSGETSVKREATAVRTGGELLSGAANEGGCARGVVHLVPSSWHSSGSRTRRRFLMRGVSEAPRAHTR